VAPAAAENVLENGISTATSAHARMHACRARARHRLPTPRGYKMSSRSAFSDDSEAEHASQILFSFTVSGTRHAVSGTRHVGAGDAGSRSGLRSTRAVGRPAKVAHPLASSFTVGAAGLPDRRLDIDSTEARMLTWQDQSTVRDLIRPGGTKAKMTFCTARSHRRCSVSHLQLKPEMTICTRSVALTKLKRERRGLNAFPSAALKLPVRAVAEGGHGG